MFHRVVKLLGYMLWKWIVAVFTSKLCKMMWKITKTTSFDLVCFKNCFYGNWMQNGLCSHCGFFFMWYIICGLECVEKKLWWNWLFHVKIMEAYLHHRTFSPQFWVYISLLYYFLPILTSDFIIMRKKSKLQYINWELQNVKPELLDVTWEWRDINSKMRNS